MQEMGENNVGKQREREERGTQTVDGDGDKGGATKCNQGNGHIFPVF